MDQGIGKEIEWIFKRLRKPPLLWHLASSITIATVGFLSKVITGNEFNYPYIMKSFLNENQYQMQ